MEQKTKLTNREILDKIAIEEIYGRIKASYPDYYVKEYDLIGFKLHMISKTIPHTTTGFLGRQIVREAEKAIVKITGTRELYIFTNDSNLIRVCEEVIKTPDPNSQGLILHLKFKD